MPDLFLDIESYYDTEYTLKKMSTWAYIFDPRFELHGLSYAYDDGPTYWVTPQNVPEFVASVPAGTVMISHNAMFDACVMFQRYGLRASRYMDSLAMARIVIGDSSTDLDLDTCCRHFGIEGKQGADALDEIKGLRLAELQPDTLARLITYGIGDTEALRSLYRELRPLVPTNQDWHINWAVESFVFPSLRLDKHVLQEIITEREKLESIVRASVPYELAIFRSRDKFAALLESLGYRPPMKVSGRTGKAIPAFSKTDFEFSEFQAQAPADIALLCRTFSAVISNINHTRAKKYLHVANSTTDAVWPVHLNHSGAKQTHRASGGSGGGGNPQNLARGGRLRDAIIAPPGYVIIAPDLNAIELRISMSLCQVLSVLSAFLNDQDPYRMYVARQYGINESQVTDEMRFLGKVRMLSLQYAVGPKTYGLQAWQRTGQPITMDQAKADVHYYRQTYYEVPRTWKTFDTMLASMIHGQPLQVPNAPFLTVEKDRIILPSGLALKYNKIRFKNGVNRRQVVCTAMKKELKPFGYQKRLYGGHILENLAQAIAGEVIREKRKLLAENVYRPAMDVHDELPGIVHHTRADWAVDEAIKILAMPVDWWPELPIKAECGVGFRYGEAK